MHAYLSPRLTRLSALDRLEEAIRLAELAIQLQPKEGDGHNTLALLLRSVGRHDEALAAFDRAISLLPQPGSAISNKALTLREMGRRAESLAAFDEALRVQPSLVAAWFGRGEFKTFEADDPDIAAMEKLLASGEAQAYDDRMRLHFALGKAYLDAKMATPAFSHLAEGNRMKRATLAFDGGWTARWMQAIAEAFPEKRFRQLQGSGAPDETPVFVLGMPRSGTTLVEQVLAAHPAVHGAGELTVMPRLVQRMHGPNRMPLPFPDFVDLLRPEHLAQAGGRYLAETVKLAPSAKRIVDKMPANFLYVGLIHLALPGARIIHIRRDPLDTCLSCYTKLFTGRQDFSYDLKELGRFYRSYQALTAHWRETLPASHFLEVDYEAVVEDVEGQARRMLKFLDLPWDERVLKFYMTERSLSTASVNQVREPIYRLALVSPTPTASTWAP